MSERNVENLKIFFLNWIRFKLASQIFSRISLKLYWFNQKNKTTKLGTSLLQADIAKCDERECSNQSLLGVWLQIPEHQKNLTCHANPVRIVSITSHQTFTGKQCQTFSHSAINAFPLCWVARGLLLQSSLWGTLFIVLLSQAILIENTKLRNEQFVCQKHQRLSITSQSLHRFLVSFSFTICLLATNLPSQEVFVPIPI